MKRPPPSIECETAVKRRRRLSLSDDDDGSRPASVFKEDPPMHKIYNSACRKEKPDELFRKDLISAMKLPDSEQLDESDFWDVSDSWKQEWERGVQVPVNQKNVPNPNVRIIHEKSKSAFKLPKKFLRTSKDSFFSEEIHVLTDVATKAEAVCKYDMDDVDCQYLRLFNERREELGLSLIDEVTMEKVIEDFETQCSNRFQDALKTEKGLGIEYDEDVNCDVCKSPDCEDGNEMVFCDSCNICVHQACYGITAIPEGSWICKPCTQNVKPTCVLCPNPGGAMKSSANGDKWAHVSCALWIPEVSIGCPEKMEPIIKIASIPASRWNLICSICRERVGACIQCTVKQCKIAYHVTCAFESGLEMEMKTAAIDSTEEGVKMQSYCHKHCKNPSDKSPSKTPSPSVRKQRKKKETKNKEAPPNEVDEHNARLEKIRSLEAQFPKYVNIKDTSDLHNVDIQVVEFLFYYWTLKRRAKFNKPLLITKCDEQNLLLKQHENLLYSRLKMFVHLRQDLERVRNLCYMVSRREKFFRLYLRARRDIFEKQNEILTDETYKLTPKEVDEVLRARFGTMLFDKIYGVDMEEEKKEDTEHKAESSVSKTPNPYAKNYTNNVHTRSRRRTTSNNLQEDPCEDSESNEMPILTKCKSDESLNRCEDDDKKESPSFRNAPFVIKLDSSVNGKAGKAGLNRESVVDNVEETIKYDFSDLEMPKITSETNVCNSSRSRKHSTAIETSNDKNSLCLSDKENMNGYNPVKTKKTRSQSDNRNSDFKNITQDLVSPTLEVFDDETLSSDIGSPHGKRKFRFGRRSTRYQMRNRRSSNDVFESEDSPLKSPDSCDSKIQNLPTLSFVGNSPSDSTDLFSPDSVNETDDSMPVLTSQPPKRGRGRPRKIPLPPDTDFSVIKDVVKIEEKDNSFLESSNTKSFPVTIKQEPVDPEENCNSLPELANVPHEKLGFRMSLRHSREPSLSTPASSSSKTDEKEGSVCDSLPELSDTSEPVGFSMSLRHSHKDVVCLDDLSDNEHQLTKSPKSKNKRSKTRKPSIIELEGGGCQSDSDEPPKLSRIVIRLRKDPNREAWKNDSSSSSDVAFRIVRDDDIPTLMDKDCDVLDVEESSPPRYSMRERNKSKS